MARRVTGQPGWELKLSNAGTEKSGLVRRAVIAVWALLMAFSASAGGSDCLGENEKADFSANFTGNKQNARQI